MTNPTAGDAARPEIRRVGSRRVVTADTGEGSDAAPQPPQQTRDDTDAGWGDTHPRADGSGHDEWLRAQRPPHWG